jgi:hypothetical protein
MALTISNVQFTGDGVTTRFNTGIRDINSTNLLVFVNGFLQAPGIDYTAEYYDVNFADAPFLNSDVEIRYINTTDVGYQGSEGYQGSSGTEGPQGVDGFQGAVGYQGSAGEQGAAGTPGGDVGYTGSEGVGYTGSEGSGYTGSMGEAAAPRSSQYITTNDGVVYILNEYVTDPTHIIVNLNGFVQIPGIDYTVVSGYQLLFYTQILPNTNLEIKYFGPVPSYQGSVGFVGSVGFLGSVGYQGSVGFLGSVGYQGSKGVTGDPGGSQGYSGSLGYTGSTGSGYTGSIGPSGAPKITKLFTANGTDTLFDTGETIAEATNVFVVVNGLVLIPETDYTIVDGSKVNITTPPFSTSTIEVRIFQSAGYIGSTGYKGSVGYQGSAGISYVGSSGYNGSLGYVGSVGFVGSIGYTGSIGPMGPPNGYTGSQGPAGYPKENQIINANGTDYIFDLNKKIDNTKSIFIFINGLGLVPDEDYTIINDGMKLSLSSVPFNGSTIEVRYFSDATGYQGSVGYKGSEGYRGSEGYQGSVGYLGSVGYRGSKGDTGDPGGPQGYTGSVGYVGSVGTGFVGSQGPAGSPKAKQVFTSDGIVKIYSLNTNVETPQSIFVMLNGSVLIPDDDYTIQNNNTLVLTAIPTKNSSIEVRYFGSTGYIGSSGYRGSVGYQGSAGAAGIAQAYVSAFAPPVSERVPGELWWDTDNGILNIYYSNEQTWVGLAEGPRGPFGYTGSGGLGYTGSAGAGYVGSRGYSGSVGFTGSIGSLGYTGSRGYNGSVGYLGSVGFTGSVGYVGSVGYTGSKGAGYDGSLGYTGSIGFTGSVGYVGSRGYTGSVGYVGSVGFVGSIGYTGSKGVGWTGPDITITISTTVPSGGKDGDIWYRYSI